MPSYHGSISLARSFLHAVCSSNFLRLCWLLCSILLCPSILHRKSSNAEDPRFLSAANPVCRSLFRSDSKQAAPMGNSYSLTIPGAKSSGWLLRLSQCPYILYDLFRHLRAIIHLLWNDSFSNCRLCSLRLFLQPAHIACAKRGLQVVFRFRISRYSVRIAVHTNVSGLLDW